MSASGGYGPTRACAGIVGYAELRLGDAVQPVMDAHLRAGGGRFRGIRQVAVHDAAAHAHYGHPPGTMFDRGPGLPPGAEGRVFERFYRGAHTAIGGVGLGLPICRGIAEAHGGTIEAANRPEGGAAFRVRIPLMGDAPTVPKDSAPETT